MAAVTVAGHSGIFSESNGIEHRNNGASVAAAANSDSASLA